MILVIAAVVGALVASNLPGDIASYTKSAICKVAQSGDCGTPGSGDQNGGDQGPAAKNGNPTGAPTAGPPAPASSTEQEYEDARREKEAADREASDAETDFGDLKKELLDLLKGLVGIEDIQKCLTEGDISSCLWALAGALPLGKALKFAKMIPKLAKFLARTKKLWDKVQNARKRRKAADDRFRKAEDACKIDNSFVPGTAVLLADGSRRPIDDVDVGDRVWAADPAARQAGDREVTALIASTGVKRLVDLTIDLDGAAGGPTADLTATAGHPFWVASESRWIDAGDLFFGDRLSTPGGGRPMVLRAREYTRTSRAHNLSVAGLHTYHVTVGGQDVLVHNCGKGKPVNLPAWKKIDIDIDHIVDGHTKGGKKTAQGAKKDLFPDGMTPDQISRTVRQAYRNGSRVRTQGERVLVRGQHDGLNIEMWVNTKTKRIETAYPINR